MPTEAATQGLLSLAYIPERGGTRIDQTINHSNSIGLLANGLNLRVASPA